MIYSLVGFLVTKWFTWIGCKCLSQNVKTVGFLLPRPDRVVINYWFCLLLTAESSVIVCLLIDHLIRCHKVMLESCLVKCSLRNATFFNSNADDPREDQGKPLSGNIQHRAPQCRRVQWHLPHHKAFFGHKHWDISFVCKLSSGSMCHQLWPLLAGMVQHR